MTPGRHRGDGCGPPGRNRSSRIEMQAESQRTPNSLRGCCNLGGSGREDSPQPSFFLSPRSGGRARLNRYAEKPTAKTSHEKRREGVFSQRKAQSFAAWRKGGGGMPLPTPRGLPRRHSAFFAGSRKPFQTSKLAVCLGSFSQESACVPSVPHSEEASTTPPLCGRLRSPPEAARKAPTGVFRQGRTATPTHQGRDTPAKAAKAQIGGCARRRTQALCPRAWA